MPANYNNIASFYDLLSRLVYGNNIVKAQTSLLKFIQPGSRILLVGGGTGWILEEIAKQHTWGLSIDYVEYSKKMIAIAERRKYGTNAVQFINQGIEDFSSAGLYDVIFTPFIFDNFKEEKIKLVFSNLSAVLRNKGIWLHCDFVGDANAPFWQRMLLKIMYLFFRITTGIETKQLIPMEKYFGKDYQKVFQEFYFGRFIDAAAYQKN